MYTVPLTLSLCVIEVVACPGGCPGHPGGPGSPEGPRWSPEPWVPWQSLDPNLDVSSSCYDFRAPPVVGLFIGQMHPVSAMYRSSLFALWQAWMILLPSYEDTIVIFARIYSVMSWERIVYIHAFPSFLRHCFSVTRFCFVFMSCKHGEGFALGRRCLHVMFVINCLCENCLQV